MPTLRITPVLAIALMVVLAVVSLAGYKTYDYVQHDPAFCINCHIMDEAYDKWSDSVHSEITCHDCHIPKLSSNIKQLYVYLTDPPEKPRHRPELENSICVRCHNSEPGAVSDDEKGNGHWQAVMAEAGHREHVGKQKIQCIRCHSTSLHQFEPPEKICQECHKHTTLEESVMDQHCTSCHQFRAVEREHLRPQRQDCLECHRWLQVSAEIFPDDGEHGSMHWECSECHKPHSKPLMGRADCLQCHESQLEESPLHGPEAHAECTSCHQPHGWQVNPETSCMMCHGNRAEHADGIACNVCHQ